MLHDHPHGSRSGCTRDRGKRDDCMQAGACRSGAPQSAPGHARYDASGSDGRVRHDRRRDACLRSHRARRRAVRACRDRGAAHAAGARDALHRALSTGARCEGQRRLRARRRRNDARGTAEGGRLPDRRLRRRVRARSPMGHRAGVRHVRRRVRRRQGADRRARERRASGQRGRRSRVGVARSRQCLSRLRSSGKSASSGEARRPPPPRLRRVRRSFSEGGSASGAKSALLRLGPSLRRALAVRAAGAVSRAIPG